MLNSRNQKLVLISGIPIINYSPRICLQSYSKFNNKCSEKINLFNESNNNEIEKLFLKLERNKDNKYKFIDIYTPIRKFLIKDKESYLEYYFNENHLTINGSLILYDLFEKEFIY